MGVVVSFGTEQPVVAFTFSLVLVAAFSINESYNRLKYISFNELLQLYKDRSVLIQDDLFDEYINKKTKGACFNHENKLPLITIYVVN